MSLTSVDICNMALGHVGAANSITAIDGTDTSAEATQCKLWYDQCRKDVLTLYNWSFARKRDDLVELLTDDPPDSWGFRYAYPSDCLKVCYLVNPVGRDADAVPYELELNADDSARTILTDLDDAVMVYTKDVETVTQFTPQFVDMLAHWLAYRIAFTLTADPRIEQKEFQTFMSQWRILTAIDANEGMPSKPRDASWIEARNN